MYGTIYNRLLCEINGRYINMFKNIVVRAGMHNMTLQLDFSMYLMNQKQKHSYDLILTGLYLFLFFMSFCGSFLKSNKIFKEK